MEIEASQISADATTYENDADAVIRLQPEARAQDAA